MSKKMGIVVMASGNGSTFQAIVERCRHAEVLLLATDRCDCHAIERAKRLGINTYCVERKDSVELHRRLGKVLKEEKPDLVVLAGYMRILPNEFLDLFPGKVVNIHPSLLPKYKGLNTYQRALEAGETVHGTTVHWVVSELDSGPIIAQEKVWVWEGDTLENLQERTQDVERNLYPYIIDQLATGEIKQT